MNILKPKGILIGGIGLALLGIVLWGPGRANVDTPELKIMALDPNNLPQDPKETPSVDWPAGEQINSDDFIGLWEYHGMAPKGSIPSMGSYHTFGGVTYTFHGNLDMWAHRDAVLNIRPDGTAEYRYVRQEFRKDKNCVTKISIEGEGKWRHSAVGLSIDFKEGRGLKTTDNPCNPQNSKESPLDKVVLSDPALMKDSEGQQHLRLKDRFTDFPYDKGMDLVRVE